MEIQFFEADFLWKSIESQPQNTEFIDNPYNFHPCDKIMIYYTT